PPALERLRLLQRLLDAHLPTRATHSPPEPHAGIDEVREKGASGCSGRELVFVGAARQAASLAVTVVGIAGPMLAWWRSQFIVEVIDQVTPLWNVVAIRRETARAVIRIGGRGPIAISDLLTPAPVVERHMAIHLHTEGFAVVVRAQNGVLEVDR